MYETLCEKLSLPIPVVNLIFQYVASPTSSILRVSKYFHHPSPYRKLKEVSHFPRLCSRHIRADYYWIYRQTFFDFLRNANLDIDINHPLFTLPTTHDWDMDESL